MGRLIVRSYRASNDFIHYLSLIIRDDIGDNLITSIKISLDCYFKKNNQ